jgi:methyl-accepting chemotaxis protein
MKTQRRQFKNYWIHPRFQTRYIGTLVGNAIISLLLFGYVIYSTYRDNIELILSMVPDPAEINERLAPSNNLLVFNFVFAGIVFIITTALVALIFSHKTAGPLFHIKKVAQKIHSGEMSSRIKLRPGDDFREVAEHLNSAFEKISNPEGKYFQLAQHDELSNIPMTLERLSTLVKQGYVTAENLVFEINEPDKKEPVGALLKNAGLS